MTKNASPEPDRCQTCFRVLNPEDRTSTTQAVCGCHVTEPHRFVPGYGMRTCWTCGKGGTAKIHKVADQ